MPPNPSSTANLPCEQCGYLNEPERVYCHNCGSKLDRSLLPKADKKKQEDPEVARKRISKMTNPNSNSVGRQVKAFFKATLGAVAVAALIVMAKTPDGVPDPKQTLSVPRLVSSDMMEALESTSPRAISFNDDEINAYLKKVVKPVDGWIPGTRLDRIIVNNFPGTLRLIQEESVFGFAIYGVEDFQLSVENGKFVSKVIGLHIGRLPVDPGFFHMVQGDGLLGMVGEMFQRERKQMDQMQNVILQKGQITLVTKGAGR